MSASEFSYIAHRSVKGMRHKQRKNRSRKHTIGRWLLGMMFFGIGL
jgi:hypothetical protein